MLVDYGICDYSIIQKKKPATADFLCAHNERKSRAADRQLCLIIYNYCVIDVIPSIAMSNAGAEPYSDSWKYPSEIYSVSLPSFL